MREGVYNLFVQICQISFTYSSEPKSSKSGYMLSDCAASIANGPNLLVS
jgi:hypothetical protein